MELWLSVVTFLVLLLIYGVRVHSRHIRALAKENDHLRSRITALENEGARVDAKKGA